MGKAALPPSTVYLVLVFPPYDVSKIYHAFLGHSLTEPAAIIVPAALPRGSARALATTALWCPLWYHHVPFETWECG